MQNSFDDVIDKLDNKELWDFPGGVFPPERKTLSNQTPINKLPIPEHLYITVKQHIGVEGQLIVVVGQKVLKGQALTKNMNPFAGAVHAPTSGEVTAIQPHVSAHPSGLPELTVEITSDKHDKWITLEPIIDYQARPKIEVLSAICDAGISGMGGAGFPTHIKSSSNKDIDFLIINGIECEPYITSDDRLMREHAWQIRQGIDVLCYLLEPKHVLIGIENNKPEAIEAMEVACRENSNYRICAVPTKYPAGGEKQLIQVLTNREVPAQGLPADVGVIMHNVGTCFAVADAIFSGKPLIQRVVTVTGEAIQKPGNHWALIGSPITHLLTHSKYNKTAQTQPNIIMGGPMMGFNVVSELVPVVKITNCILAPTDKEIAKNNEQACIRCGACADVCPASLLPQQLFWHAKAKELDKAQDYNLFDCIECGACAYVCPSEIPLVHYYRIAKSEIRVEQEEKQKSDKARERFEKREARLIAEQKARDEKHRLAAETRRQAMESNGNGAKDKIAAALARAKAKKQAAATIDDKPIEPTDELTQANQLSSLKPAEPSTKTTSSNQRVQAAIARAKAKKAAVNLIEPQTKPKAEEKQTALNQQIIQEQAVIDPSNGSTANHNQNKTGANQPKLQQEPMIDDSKQAKIAAAVAKAKAKRGAQKAAVHQPKSKPKSDAGDDTISSPVEPASTEEQHIDMKKRRIAAAVAKAKAKKAAENKEAENSATNSATNNKEDKPL